MVAKISSQKMRLMTHKFGLSILSKKTAFNCSTAVGAYMASLNANIRFKSVLYTALR